jgi:DNA gyrase inhibitor GyrI
LRGVQRVPEIGVLAHAIAVAANRDDVAMVDEPIDERGRHHVVAEDVPNSGFQPDDRPCFELYAGKAEANAPKGCSKCEICMPVRPL